MLKYKRTMINKMNIVIIKITFFPQKEHIFLVVSFLLFKHQFNLFTFLTSIHSCKIYRDFD